MRTALAILMLCVCSHQLLMKLGIVAWYEYNKAYITQNLCENRDKPAMKCCGKCLLRKKLAKADGEGVNSGAISLLSKMEVGPFIVPVPVRISRVFIESADQRFYYDLPFAEAVSFGIEHPPG